MTRYLTFHGACLDTHTIEPGPGDLVVTARQPMALLGHEPDHLGLLEAGAPLFVEARVACLRTAVLRHCFGIGEPSEFRAAIAERLDPPANALEPRPLDARRINAWLSHYTVVSVRSYRAGAARERRVGWLNRMDDAAAAAPFWQQER